MKADINNRMNVGKIHKHWKLNKRCTNNQYIKGETRREIKFFLNQNKNGY